MHVLSCFVHLKSVLLISCVFWICFSERWQSALFHFFLRSTFCSPTVIHTTARESRPSETKRRTSRTFEKKPCIQFPLRKPRYKPSLKNSYHFRFRRRHFRPRDLSSKNDWLTHAIPSCNGLRRNRESCTNGRTTVNKSEVSLQEFV